jgi:hypothetical protein
LHCLFEIYEGMYALQKRTVSARYLIYIFKLELNFMSRILQIYILYRPDQLLSKYLMRFRTNRALIVQCLLSTSYLQLFYFLHTATLNCQINIFMKRFNFKVIKIIVLIAVIKLSSLEYSITTMVKFYSNP